MSLVRWLLPLACLLPCVAQGQGVSRLGPSAEVAAIASQIEVGGGADLAYVVSFTSVNIIRGHAWIASTYTGDLARFGAEYVVVSQIDGALTVELLTGPGETQVLRAAGARRYLADVAFDTAPLERAYQRHYAPRPPGGG